MLPGLPTLPPQLVAFVTTVVLSFVLGLELHSYRRVAGHDLGFGTTRTLTLVAVLGFVLWALDGKGLLFTVGLVVVGAWLAVYYWHRSGAGTFSLLPTLFALLIYLLGPITLELPRWFVVLYVVVLILLLGEKPGIRRLSDAFRSEEGVTLAKFLILSGLVLPLLPAQPIAPWVAVTWYQVWLAVLVVSGISYASYLLQTYFVSSRGPLITGVLGGLYSSTATTVVLARRARSGATELLAPALVLATAMMYLRLWLIILLLGHAATALRLAFPFVLFVVASLFLAWRLAGRSAAGEGESVEAEVHHPLELPTALLFAALFVLFAALTQYVIGEFGSSGLHLLSFLAGITDVDPFVLSLLAGKFAVSAGVVASAVLVVSGSNNLLKAVYALILARRREVLPAALWLVALLLASLLYARWVL